MKTMRTPKMDVVRFTESDVIVASSKNYDNLSLAKYNNGTLEDATINGDSIATFVRVADSLHTNTSSIFLYDHGNSVSVSQLLDKEETNTITDGTYEWNGTNGWNHQ